MMKHQALELITLLLVIPLLYSQTTSNDCTQYPPGLSFDQFNEVLDTISEKEFKNGDEKTWYEANCYAWNEAMLLESKFPYLVCDQRGGSNGRDRYEFLRNAFKNVDGDVYNDENPAIITALNTAEYSCFITSVPATDMIQLPAQYGFSGILITPISYYMKIIAGTLSSIADESDNAFITLDSMICPGVLEDLSQVSDVDNLSESILNYILEPNVDTGKSNALEDLFWGQTVAQTDQAKAFLEMAQVALDPNSEQCKALYESLIFQFYRAGTTSAYNAATMMETRFYTSIVQPSDFKECASAIILAMALKPEICSLQVRPTISIKQVNNIEYTYNRGSFGGESSGYKANQSHLHVLVMLIVVGVRFIY